VTRAAVSPDGTLVAATTTDGHVRIYNLAEKSLVRDLHVLDDLLWSVAFNADGRTLAVASSDEVVSLWDVTSSERLGDLAGHTGGATDVAFLADGATLAVVDRRGSLHLWDTARRRRLSAPIAAHAGASWRLAVTSRTEAFLTSGDDGSVRAWDILGVAKACEIGVPAFDRERQREYFGEEQHPLACAALSANATLSQAAKR
jgi:WD40 repeat protein